MEPVTVVISPPHFYFIAGLLMGIVGGWFAGGWYKSRRNEGMGKEEIAQEAQDQIKAQLKVVLNKLEELKK